MVSSYYDMDPSAGKVVCGSHLLVGGSILFFQRPTSLVAVPVLLLLLGCSTGLGSDYTSSVYRGYLYFISCIALFAEFHLLYPSIQSINIGLVIGYLLVLCTCVYIGIQRSFTYFSELDLSERLFT